MNNTRTERYTIRVHLTDSRGWSTVKYTDRIANMLHVPEPARRAPVRSMDELRERGIEAERGDTVVRRDFRLVKSATFTDHERGNRETQEAWYKEV